MQVGVKIKIFLDRQVLVESELLRHVADPVLHGLGFGANVQPEYPQLPSIGLHQPGDQSQQGGLAGTVRPDQGAEPPRRNPQADLVERD